jgi:hypothetical protein
LSRLVPYESKIVSVVFGALILEDGRADPFFTISAQGPAYIMEGPGADGHIARCGTNNNAYVITLGFKGTSSEIAKLTAIHLADRAAFNGAGIAPLFCKDANGSTLIATDQAWITQLPEVSFGVNKPDVSIELHAVIPPGGFLAGGA